MIRGVGMCKVFNIVAYSIHTCKLTVHSCSLYIPAMGIGTLTGSIDTPTLVAKGIGTLLRVLIPMAGMYKEHE